MTHEIVSFATEDDPFYLVREEVVLMLYIDVYEESWEKPSQTFIHELIFRRNMEYKCDQLPQELSTYSTSAFCSEQPLLLPEDQEETDQ